MSLITRILAKVIRKVDSFLEVSGIRGTSPQACRVTDQSGGDGNCVQGSPNVFVNGLPLTRLGDAFQDGVLTTASHTVFSNGIPVGRLGDTVTGLVVCEVITGSNNVTVGG